MGLAAGTDPVRAVQLAKAEPAGPGFTIDYETLASASDFTFEGGRTYFVGPTNSFTYTTDSQATVTNMVTPYGTTSFQITQQAKTATNYVIRSARITLPNGANELYLYRDYTPFMPGSYPGSVVPSNALARVGANFVDNGNMSMRNSFHWDARGYELLSEATKTNLSNLTSNDVKVAHVRHWHHGDSDDVSVGRCLSMERLPSPDGAEDGQTIWYNYYGKSVPWREGPSYRVGITATVLPDGSERFTDDQRNDLGHPTNIVSSYSVNGTVLERTNRLVYADNDIDLLESYLDNLSGLRIMAAGYNGLHQITALTNAVDDVTHYTYDADTHLLTRIIFPTGLTTTNIYASSGPSFLLETTDLEISRTYSFTYSFSNGVEY